MNRFNDIICHDTGEVCTSYKDYLLSNHWKNLKIRWLKTKIRLCGVCRKSLNYNDEFDFHHLTYKRIGKEKLKDVMITCRDGCNSNAHSQEFNNRLINSKKNSFLQDNVKPSASVLVREKVLKENKIRKIILEINVLTKSKNIDDNFKVKDLKKTLYSLY
jgi:hypothetical protein